MQLWLQALVYGLCSALSLPVGAVFGILLAPVTEKVTARWMAFGSGALVFAVATQLYGQALFGLYLAYDKEKHEGGACDAKCQVRFKNVMIQNGTGILGAILYVLLNRWLEALVRPKPVSGQSEEPRPSIGSGPLQDMVSITEQGSQARDRFLHMSRQSASSAPPVPLSSPIAALSSLRRATSNVGLEGSAFGTAIISHDGAGRPSVTPRASLGGGGAALQAHDDVAQKVAFSMWLGLLLDGIPEALMLGFMTNEGTISFEFIIAIFIANFPEAFSGSSLLSSQGMAKHKIFLMWFIVFALTGFLAMLGSIIMPDTVNQGSVEERVRDTSTAALEGLTGGAMLAMISTAMLPEAFKGAGEMAGILFVLGFVTSVWIQSLGARFGGPQG